MKKKNFLSFPFLLGLGISLFSCNYDTGGNVQTFQNVPAVVGWDIDMGGTYIGTMLGYIAAPSLIDNFDGDCIYISQFTIDYDNQPSDTYYTAINIVKEDVNQSPIEIRDNIELGDYTLPLYNLGALGDEFFQGKFFIAADCKDRNPSFRLIYNSEEEEINDVKNLYIQARPSIESSSNIAAIHAFDVSHFIQSCGRDTAKIFKGSSEKYNFKYIKANLVYVSKVTDGIPEYTILNDKEPVEIYIFNNQ